MFVTGAQARISGFGHRDDPAACYLEDITIGDAPKRNRNDQFTTHGRRPIEPAEAPTVGRAEHLGRLGAGAVRHRRAADAAAAISCRRASIAAVEVGAARDERRAAVGLGPAARDVHGARQSRGRRVSDVVAADNPRLRCRPTSIIFDWVFDGAVNRITQEQDRIVINYGLYSFERVIHMNMAQHPANIAPSLRGPFDRPVGRRRARRRHRRLRARRHRGAACATATSCTSSSASRSIPRSGC